MSGRRWQTNAPELIELFAQLHGLVADDVQSLLSFARRLEIDPLDILATKDHVGEYHCRIGPSTAVPGRVLACGYRIDVPHRSVEVISFYLPPERNRPTSSAFEAPVASRMLTF